MASGPRPIPRPRPPTNLGEVPGGKPAGETLGDPRPEVHEDEHTILPDSWFTPEKPAGPEVLPEGFTIDMVASAPTTELGLSDDIRVDLRKRVKEYEDYWRDMWGGYSDPGGWPPTQEVPEFQPIPGLAETEQGFSEALRANDNIVVESERPYDDSPLRWPSRAFHMYFSANQWRYTPWFKKFHDRNHICNYVSRRDHKGSGNRKGKKRGLAEQQQIKMWYLCHKA